ncbi:hypothetical protein [Candidatus Thioglobus sp.]|uniref:hypothetical protein n=1 Tax=Candidatus Thioglobus sp. TaxID=2026721 RepID=UPI003D0EDC04
MENKIKQYDVIIIGAGAAGKGNSWPYLKGQFVLNTLTEFIGNKFARFCLNGK